MAGPESLQSIDSYGRFFRDGRMAKENYQKPGSGVIPLKQGSAGVTVS